MEYKTTYQSIVLMGKIASGKGTQANEIINSFGGTLYSNGNKVRETSQSDTVLGGRMKKVYEAGTLIPEWIASYWMTHALLSQHPDDRLVFEAVAKKPDEAVLFNDIHEWMNRPYVVFNLNVPDEVVKDRSHKRNRDVVDNDEAVIKRLDEYAKHTEKSIDLFRSYGKVIDIDGTKTLDDVRQNIFDHLIS